MSPSPTKPTYLTMATVPQDNKVYEIVPLLCNGKLVFKFKDSNQVITAQALIPSQLNPVDHEKRIRDNDEAWTIRQDGIRDYLRTPEAREIVLKHTESAPTEQDDVKMAAAPTPAPASVETHQLDFSDLANGEVATFSTPANKKHKATGTTPLGSNAVLPSPDAPGAVELTHAPAPSSVTAPASVAKSPVTKSLELPVSLSDMVPAGYMSIPHQTVVLLVQARELEGKTTPASQLISPCLFVGFEPTLIGSQHSTFQTPKSLQNKPKRGPYGSIQR